MKKGWSFLVVLGLFVFFFLFLMSLNYKHSYLIGFYNCSDGPVPPIRKDIKFLYADFNIPWISFSTQEPPVPFQRFMNTRLLRQVDKYSTPIGMVDISVFSRTLL